MSKNWIAFGFLFGFVGFTMLAGGCAQTAEEAATTTTTCTATTTTTASTTTSTAGGATTTTTTTSTTSTTGASAASVTIKGTTATGVTALSIKAQAGLAGAHVSIGVPTKDSDAVVEVAHGTADTDGNYSIDVPISLLAGVTASNGYATNITVTASKDGTVIGCIIPSFSPEAGKENYAPPATKGDYVKQKIARECFEKGMDPKAFDYNGNINQKLSSAIVKDYDATKIDAVADSIKSGEDAEDEIAQGLGISTTIIQQMKQKRMELYKIYVEPIMGAAFESKTPPNREQLDTAFASMEAAMMTYAKELGTTEQQLSDFRSIKDKTVETQMGQETAIKDDPGFGEAKRRMMGNKVITLFLGQWDAANVLATVAPSGKITFAVSNEANYNKFVASKEVIVAALTAMMNNAQITDPRHLCDYLRNGFFDAFIYPPPSGMPSSEGGQQPEEGKMSEMMSNYTSSRIMVYFMKTFFTDMQQRQTFFVTTEATMKPIFEKRFNDPSASYYMGPNFWTTNPSPEEIQTRLTAFNNALTAAVDNNDTLKTLFQNIGFSNAQITPILKAFRIIMAPPDMMI